MCRRLEFAMVLLGAMCALSESAMTCTEECTALINDDDKKADHMIVHDDACDHGGESCNAKGHKMCRFCSYQNFAKHSSPKCPPCAIPGGECASCPSEGACCGKGGMSASCLQSGKTCCAHNLGATQCGADEQCCGGGEDDASFSVCCPSGTYCCMHDFNGYQNQCLNQGEKCNSLPAFLRSTTSAVAVPKPSAQRSAVVTCDAVQGAHDLVAHGQRWIKSPKCLNCKGDACLGCLKDDVSECGLCLYDMDKCRKSLGVDACVKTAVGATIRGDSCEGTPLPFAGGTPEDPGFHCGLKPGNDITQLNGKMTVKDARNTCASYRDANGDPACVGFTWTEGPSNDKAVRESASDVQYQIVKAGSYCNAGKAQTTSQMMHAGLEQCAAFAGQSSMCGGGFFVYLAEAYRSNETKVSCACCPPNEADGSFNDPLYDLYMVIPPGSEQYDMKFKNAWHPTSASCTKSDPVQRGLGGALDTNERSIRRAFDPSKRHKVSDANDTPSMTKYDLDDVFAACVAPSCNAFSYCPGQDPPEDEFEVFFGIGGSSDVKRNPHCFSYSFWDPDSSETSDAVTV